MAACYAELQLWNEGGDWSSTTPCFDFLHSKTHKSRSRLIAPRFEGANSSKGLEVGRALFMAQMFRSTVALQLNYLRTGLNLANKANLMSD